MPCRHDAKCCVAAFRCARFRAGAQATKVAQMAHDGFARTIDPSHTMYDGDTIFALATGELADADVTTIGALAADAVSEAIIRAIQQARSLPGYPAASDIR